jgi:hypothetical protein
VLGEDRRPVRRGDAGGVEEVLDGEPDPLGRLRAGTAGGKAADARPENPVAFGDLGDLSDPDTGRQ